MPQRHALTDEQWDRIKNLVPGKVGDRGPVWKEQSAVCGCRSVCPEDGCPVEGFARTVRELEFCLASI